MVLYDFLIFILSLVILIKGSDFFVEHSAKLARHIGVSEFVIGLTLVSIGTSLPELATSISASFSKESGLIIGNIVGSNIANIGLILAMGALLFVIKTKEKMFIKNSKFLVAITILFIILSIDGIISFIDASLFLIIFTFYLIHLFRAKEEQKEIHYEKLPKRELKKDLTKSILFILLGILGLYFGADLLIPSAINIAKFFKVPTEIIGVILIAVGTSLPELFVTITAARKNLEKILVGNIIGSNISNLLLIIGISGIINPIKISNLALLYLMPFMFVMTILFFIYIRKNWSARLMQGISLLALYLIFILVLFFIR